MPVSSLVSIISVVASPLLNGSYGVFFKSMKRGDDDDVNPLAFMIYFGLGVSLISIAETPIAGLTNPKAPTPWVSLSWWGLFSGVCFVGASASNYFAYARLGLAVVQPASAGVIIIMSLVWDVVLLGQHVDNIAGVCSAIVLITLGLTAIMGLKLRAAPSKDVPQDISHDEENQHSRMNQSSNPTKELWLNHTDTNELGKSPLMPERCEEKEDGDIVHPMTCMTGSPLLDGLLAVVVMGFCGSLVLVPMKKFIPEDQQGLHYSSGSFGLGVLAAVSMFGLLTLMMGWVAMSDMQPRRMLLPGNITNATSR